MSEITVNVRLFASLRRYQPKGQSAPVAVRLRQGAVVGDLIAALGIPAESTGIVVSDDQHLELTSPLRDGAEVSLFPPLAGGEEVATK
jgi:molybdopterin synthase sulfur carrier subunit